MCKIRKQSTFVLDIVQKWPSNLFVLTFSLFIFFLPFSFSSSASFTRVSACPIYQINKCTFVWHNFCFHHKFLVCKLVILSIKYSSIPIFAAMYAVNVTSPAQLPLVSGCQNSSPFVPTLFSSKMFKVCSFGAFKKDEKNPPYRRHWISRPMH